MGLDMYFYKMRKAKNKSINELMEIQDKINYADNTEKAQKEKERLLKEYKTFLHNHTYKYLKRIDKKFEYEIGYLRKANAIHNYIIEHFANGVDECQPIELEKEKLKELQKTIKELIYKCKLKKGKWVASYSYNKNENGELEKIYNYENGYILDKKSQELASKLLPTCDGFFFGSTDYDQWYYEDLLEFNNILNELLQTDTSKYYIYYLASW